MTDRWLEGYSGESAADLIALASSCRIDSIVLAFEQAVQAKLETMALSDLTEAELTILAVESLEREVNNGGYDQFFLNTPEYSPHVAAALDRIGCPVTAKITREAIALAGRTPEDARNDALHKACDSPYYESGEPIADRLFEYLKRNAGAVRL